MQKIIVHCLVVAALSGCGISAPDINSTTQPNTTDVTESDKEPAVGTGEDTSSVIELLPVNLAAYQTELHKKKDKVVLVEFWATWCAECKEMLPHTLELAEKYKDRGVVVMTVSLDEKEDHDAALKFLTEKNARVVNLRTNHDNFDDENPDVFELCDQVLPHVKIYDQDGKVHASFSEEDVTPENVEGAIGELVSESDGPKT